MQISLKWINELINIETVNLDELINKLTLGGFEVEEILEIKINNQPTIVLDISATANRSDSLSISGLALEMAALLKNNVKISNYRTKQFFWSKKIQNISTPVLTSFSCSDFIGVTIQNLTDQASPNWMQQKLIASGINPENSLTDFQNYMLLELGYPFEFYDLNKISGTLNTSDFDLQLSYDNNFKSFSASNGLDYDLNNSILTLKANQIPLSIAGIISNEKFCPSKETTSLLVEASIFQAAAIRRQSRMLGLRTERSSRYEKSIKNTNLLEALYRLISLLRLKNPNLNCKIHTLSQAPGFKVKTIPLSYRNIKKVLGPITKNSKEEYEYISPKVIEESLSRLQFNLQTTEKPLTWTVTVPSFRDDDIIQEIDVIEEVGRLYGFNNFLTRLPNIKRVGKKDLNYQMRKKITSCLINLGFNELIQYSLVNETDYIKNEISLLNPLVKDYSTLRSSLLPHLVKAAQDNIKKSNVILEGFEYGHIFSTNNSTNFQEKEVIAGIFGGIRTKSTWSASSQFLSWFEAKGKIEQLFNNLNLNIYWSQGQKEEKINLFHPSRVAKLSVLTGQKLGVFGQINPILAKKLNLSSDLYLFEFDFELIEKVGQQNQLTIYQEYSAYPKIIKDLSIIIDNKISFEEIKKVLFLNGSKFLVNLTLLDEYRGDSIPENSISLCLQLTFQSKETTLQNKTVEIIINSFKTILTMKFNAIIRD